MSDYDKLIATFKEIGVEFEEKAVTEGKTETVKYDGKITFDKRVCLENGVGYYGFECEFYFMRGEYKGHGVWE